MRLLSRRPGSLVVALPLSLLPATALAGPRQPTHVACVGDSITAGAGASSGATSYPAVLQGLLGPSVQVKNFGHSGATMLSAGYGDLPYQQQGEYQAATDFVSGAGAGAVVDVILMLGANDSKPQNWTPGGKPKNDQQYLEDYTAMVEHFASLPTAPVVYVALPLATGNSPCCGISGTIIHDEQIPLIMQLATSKGLPVIDLNTPTTGHPEYFGDGVHPNDAGYAVVAQQMRDGLLRVPQVSLTKPAAGSTVLLPSPVLLGSAASGGTVAISRVEFFAGETSLGVATSSPFDLTWLPTAAGAYALTARATDSTGASATSEAVSLTVTSGGQGGSSGSSGQPGAAGDGGAGTAGAGAAGVAGGQGPSGAGGSSGSSGQAGKAGAGSQGTAGVGGQGGQAAGAGEGDTSDDGGCQSSGPGAPGAGGSFALVALGWLAARRRRGAW